MERDKNGITLQDTDSYEVINTGYETICIIASKDDVFQGEIRGTEHSVVAFARFVLKELGYDT